MFGAGMSLTLPSVMVGASQWWDPQGRILQCVGFKGQGV